MTYQHEGEEQERKLFVGGLNKQSSEDQLKQNFEQYGDIIDCIIMRDQEKASRGFGFILFEDGGSVDKIMAAKKGGTDFFIDEQRIEIKRALPKVPKGNAGGGGGRSSSGGSMYRKIFVGGLPSSAVEDDLRTHFERYGRVNEIELLRDRDTGRLRGFAFVTFDEEDSADKCLQRRSHEICKKVCEVKRAQTRTTFNKGEERGGRGAGGPGGFDHHANNSAGGGAEARLSMEEVNRLIQQSFAMGQSLSQQPGLQAPTAAALLSGTASLPTQSNNNVLLQALLGQQIAPPAPVVAPPPVAPSNPGITQLASLLQSGGIDTNALVSLLRKEPEPPKPSESQPAGGGYSTSYPYTYGNTQSSNYGPAKDDDPKRGYRPY